LDPPSPLINFQTQFVRIFVTIFVTKLELALSPQRSLKRKRPHVDGKCDILRPRHDSARSQCCPRKFQEEGPKIAGKIAGTHLWAPLFEICFSRSLGPWGMYSMSNAISRQPGICIKGRPSTASSSTPAYVPSAPHLCSRFAVEDMLFKHVLLFVSALVLSASAIPAPSPQDPIMDLDLLVTDELTNAGLIIKRRHRTRGIMARN